MTSVGIRWLKLYQDKDKDNSATFYPDTNKDEKN